MLRAAIYARVSSPRSASKHTIENQLRVLPAFVARRAGRSSARTSTTAARRRPASSTRATGSRLLRDAELRRSISWSSSTSTASRAPIRSRSAR
jgi:hypothetical protein